MFNQLAIVSIPAKNQSASRAFYTQVLGGRVIEEMPFGPGTQWIRLELPGVETKIVLATWFPQMPPGACKGSSLRPTILPAPMPNSKSAALPFLRSRSSRMGRRRPSKTRMATAGFCSSRL